MQGNEPSSPRYHLLVSSVGTALAVVVLQANHIICLGQDIEIGFPPDFRPVVGLGLAGQIAVELDVGKAGVPKFQDHLGRPDIRPHAESHAEDPQIVA